VPRNAFLWLQDLIGRTNNGEKVYDLRERLLDTEKTSGSFLSSDPHVANVLTIHSDPHVANVLAIHSDLTFY